MNKTYVVTGAASGIGAATKAMLEADGHRVIGVDRVDAEVICDLATPEGRQDGVKAVQKLAKTIHGVVPCAGLAGGTNTDARLLVSVNYFGAVEFVEGLRPQLTAAKTSAVVMLASNSTTCQPAWPAEVSKACVSGNEEQARKVAGGFTSTACYPASKAALAWWARKEGVKPEWIGAGIRINSIAPGLIATAMTEGVKKDPVFGKFADSYPTALGRSGRADEIASVIKFLLSEESSLMVGAMVVADGGTDAIKNPQWPNALLNNIVTSRVIDGAMKVMQWRAKK